jgi:hypothetical protein
MIYPPVLEMLDDCYRGNFDRVHLASPGPVGLAGLFIARFLKLPLEADFSDLLPRLARELTRDGFIEELCWRYTIWFFNQADAVYVDSRTMMAELSQRGIPRAKLRLAPAHDAPESRVSAALQAAGRRRREAPAPQSAAGR